LQRDPARAAAPHARRLATERFENFRKLTKGDSMARQSAQHKLDRVRPPRVQITYDVEVGGAIEVKELPFVAGVLGDFTGQPEQPLPRLKDRKFVEVNPDNFDSVLEGMKPHLSYAVENKLSEDPNAPQLKVDLKFRKMEDFEPANVAKQVKPLKELMDLRTRLSDLRGSLQGNDKLEEVLLDAVSNTEKLDKLKGEIGTGEKKDGDEGGSNG
jgi:type VI secretion system protein ImpB